MQTVAGVLATGVAYYVYQRVRDSPDGEKESCKPPLCDYVDPIGVSGLYRSLRASNENRFLDFVQEEIDSVGRRVGRPLRTVSVRVLFFQNAIFTFDPLNVQAILGLRFDDFELGTSRIEGFRPYLGTGIFAAVGKQWELSRNLLRPHLFRSRIDLEQGERHVQAFITALDRRREPSRWTKLTDLQDLFFHYTLDSTIEFLFGRNVNSQLGEETQDVSFSKAIHQSQSGISLSAKLGPFYWLAHTPEFKRHLKTINQVVDPWIDAAIKQRQTEEEVEQENCPLLYALTKQTEDPIELRNQLLSLLVAGHDTTASTLAWFVILMADRRNEAIFQRLRASILDHFGDGSDPKEVTFGRVKSCRYLQWCIDETLRLYPAVPMNIRVAKRDTCLPTGGGPEGLSPILLKRGEEVTFSHLIRRSQRKQVHLMHRCKEIWGEDADVFRPERWENKPSRWNYVPFNDGPRSCIGQQYAMVRIAHLVIRLLQRVDGLDGSQLGSVGQHLTLVNLPDNGVKVRLRFAD
ncbi:hypothetical protein L249_4841 [Ophiocordyceps polyrhachis-furcata BCC 54312]|uniref:Cytochrome P450 n=1 Tax=Ophiocordyceps polyrhachis-furcata BCC 54312 TaxID=1330021 RepID=A0A367L319_9HYPO|nr:hypothetical protein L249_4841 [Ophiocordyceps polyrhachis-furcata BCC 54312]